MADTRFTLETDLPVHPDVVFGFFCDPRNLLDVQPLLTDISLPHHNNDPDGVPYLEFTITERVPVLGPIATTVRSQVRLRVDPTTRQTRDEVQSSLGVQLTATTHATPNDNGGTHLVRAIQLSAPGLLSGFVTGQARRAQHALIRNLETHFTPQP